MSGNCTQAAAVYKQGCAAVMLCINSGEKKKEKKSTAENKDLLSAGPASQLLLPQREHETLYLYLSFAGDSEVSISDTQNDCVSQKVVVL